MLQDLARMLVMGGREGETHMCPLSSIQGAVLSIWMVYWTQTVKEEMQTT